MTFRYKIIDGGVQRWAVGEKVGQVGRNRTSVYRAFFFFLFVVEKVYIVRNVHMLKLVSRKVSTSGGVFIAIHYRIAKAVITPLISKIEIVCGAVVRPLQNGV